MTEIFGEKDKEMKEYLLGFLGDSTRAEREFEVFTRAFKNKSECRNRILNVPQKNMETQKIYELFKDLTLCMQRNCKSFDHEVGYASDGGIVIRFCDTDVYFKFDMYIREVCYMVASYRRFRLLENLKGTSIDYLVQVHTITSKSMSSIMQKINTPLDLFKTVMESKSNNESHDLKLKRCFWQGEMFCQTWKLKDTATLSIGFKLASTETCEVILNLNSQREKSFFERLGRYDTFQWSSTELLLSFTAEEDFSVSEWDGEADSYPINTWAKFATIAKKQLYFSGALIDYEHDGLVVRCAVKRGDLNLTVIDRYGIGAMKIEANISGEDENLLSMEVQTYNNRNEEEIFDSRTIVVKSTEELKVMLKECLRMPYKTKKAAKTTTNAKAIEQRINTLLRRLQ